MLPTEKVMAVLKDVKRVALFVDKSGDPVEQEHKELMLTAYNKAGAIPAYYVIGGDGEIKSFQIGSSSEDVFLEFLAKGGIKP